MRSQKEDITDENGVILMGAKVTEDDIQKEDIITVLKDFLDV